MKKVYLLFVAVILAACSAEPVENEVLSGLDANLEGKKIKATEALDPMGFYSGNSGNLKGTFEVWNDCDNLYLEITPTGDAPEDVEISFVNALPQLNNGGNYSELTIDYSLEDADNLLWTIPVTDFDPESDLFIFVKAWGDDAGSSTFGDRNHQYTDFTFDFSMCGDCEESFDYFKNEDGTYTFTYTPSEDIDGAELTFTFPQSHVNVSPDEYAQNGNGNDTTFSTILDLESCKTYNWSFELSTDCTGKGQGKVNLWTDFKVNEVSKKGDLKNITQSCL